MDTQRKAEGLDGAKCIYEAEDYSLLQYEVPDIETHPELALMLDFWQYR